MKRLLAALERIATAPSSGGDRMKPYYDEDGRKWQPVCGEPLMGAFTAFPCCLSPAHTGEHVFAAYHASYRLVGRQMYEMRGRST